MGRAERKDGGHGYRFLLNWRTDPHREPTTEAFPDAPYRPGRPELLLVLYVSRPLCLRHFMVLSDRYLRSQRSAKWNGFAIR